MTRTLLFLLLLAVFTPSNAQCRPGGHPYAEWDRAKTILMHTPGEELFNGVIHPSAGLFEHYFDVQAAAEEHRGYIRMLEKNGIKVYNIPDILGKIGIDTLRSLAATTLTYDTEDVAPLDSAANGEQYKRLVLGQMTRSDLVRCILLQPTVDLHSTDNNTKVEADYIQHPLMNLYFTRDQSINTPRGTVLCRMNSSQRMPETDILRCCYSHLGITPILEIKGEGRLEGGDYIPAGTVSFIGCGMRTNLDAITQMMQADAFGHDTVVVVRDHKLWQMQMHLDTHFNIIDRDLCTMVASRYNARPGSPEFVTVDIYARKPGTKHYRCLSQGGSFVEFLEKHGFTVIPIDESDELHYANNYLTIAPRHIMMVGGQSERLAADLRHHNVTVEWIPLENLIKGYGAAHCMTQVLERQR